MNEAKRATFGEGGEAGKQWAGDVLHEVRHNGYGPFRGPPDRVAQAAARGEAGGGRPPDRLRRGARGHDRLRPLPEERLADQLLHHRERVRGRAPRVKGGGKRRDGDNAEAMMALEAMQQSDLWNQYRATRACLNN